MDLKELLGEELYDQVKGKLGDKKLMIDDNNFVPKSRMDEILRQKNELKEQVDTLNNTLKSNAKDFEKFKTAAEGNAELQKQLQEYQDKFNNTQKEFNTTLTAKEQEWQQREINNKKAYSVREKLLVNNAKKNYIDMLMNTIDLNKVTMNDDGSFIGVDDIIKGTKESYADLFEKVQTIGTPADRGADNTHLGTNATLQQLAEKARSGKPQDRLAYVKAKQELNNQE